MRQKSERPQTVGNADQHNSLPRQLFAAVSRNRGGSDVEAAAEDPYQHRNASGRRLRRSPDIQIETILAHRRRLDALHTLRREFVRGAKTLPLRDGLRRTPAQFSHRRSRKRNASENSETFLLCALQLALLN